MVKPDLAVANSGTNTVSVYFNSSTSGSITAASFPTKVDYTTGSNAYSVTIGDLNEDGKPELVVANYVSNTVSVLQNTSSPGSISFAAKQDYATASQPVSVAIGDLDGDGKPDLAVANLTTGTVSVLQSNVSAGGVHGFKLLSKS